MKKKAIRVDADNKIGIGHLLRIKGFIYRSINEYEKFLVITKVIRNNSQSLIT